LSNFDAILGVNYTLQNSGKRGLPEDFDLMIEYIQRKEKICREMIETGDEPISIENDLIIGKIIGLAKAWSIPFEKIAPYLIKMLDPDLAKRVVRPEDLVEHCGKEALDIWKLLMEKGS
jgi:hypothetical protein